MPFSLDVQRRAVFGVPLQKLKLDSNKLPRFMTTCFFVLREHGGYNLWRMMPDRSPGLEYDGLHTSTPEDGSMEKAKQSIQANDGMWDIESSGWRLPSSMSR